MVCVSGPCLVLYTGLTCHQVFPLLAFCCVVINGPSLALSLSPLHDTHPHTDMSAQELAFGEYLGAYSEREYTNAGQVMKSSGRVLQLEAKARSVSQSFTTN